MNNFKLGLMLSIALLAAIALYVTVYFVVENYSNIWDIVV